MRLLRRLAVAFPLIALVAIAPGSRPGPGRCAVGQRPVPHGRELLGRLGSVPAHGPDPAPDRGDRSSTTSSTSPTRRATGRPMLATEWTPVDDAHLGVHAPGGRHVPRRLRLRRRGREGLDRARLGQAAADRGRWRRGAQPLGRRLGADRGRGRGRPHRPARQRRAVREPVRAARQPPSIVSSDDIGEDFAGLAAQPNGTGPFRLVEQRGRPEGHGGQSRLLAGAPQIAAADLGVHPGPRDATQRAPRRPGRRHRPRAAAAPPGRSRTPTGVSLTSATGIESVNLFVAPGRCPIWEENPSFRKAVIQSIDRDGLVTGLVQGSSAVATSFLPSRDPGPRGRRARRTRRTSKPRRRSSPRAA